MLTRIGVGLSDLADGYACGVQAAQVALSQLENPGAIALALLFTSHPDPKRVLKGVNDTLGHIPLVGATSAGQYTHEGYVEDGAGVMLIQSDEIRFHTARYQRRLFGRQKLLGNLHGITEAGLGSLHHHRALVLFPDDLSMNLDRVVERAMSETGMLYDIVGGPSPTSHRPPRPPAIFFNDRVLRGGLSATEVLSRSPLGLAFDNGWTPLSGPYRVTHADQRRIIKLDGRPTWEVYEDFLIERGITYDRDALSHVTLHHPVGVCNDRLCKVSVIMGFDSSGAMLVTSPPPVGHLVHILSTQPDAMVTAARRAVEHALERTTANAGALFIDCMSTGWVLADSYHRQREAVQASLGDIPFLGFRSHGVLARLQGQTAGHYECSVAACIFPR
ncbi:MAG: FIST C-terminal domain-containing protein [Anaerolineae bacterium]|nr:FIST C-terminal domain-containing protein [Anaerolineae bacterium]